MNRPARALAHRVGRGSLWVVFGRLSQAALALASSVVLSRMLFPGAFGLMGLVSVFLLGISLFSDMGTVPAIVRSSRGEDPDFLATAWTLQVIRGLALASLCWLLAAPYARIYDEPELRRLLPLAGLTAIVHGLYSVNAALADRRLAQGRKVAMAVVSQAASILGMVLWARADPTANALIFGGMVAAVVATALSHLILPGPRLRVRVDRDSMRELLHFGRWIFLSTAMTFVGMQGDRLFLGYALSLDALGLYFVASRVPEVFNDLHGSVATSVVFPAWVEVGRTNATELPEKLRRSRAMLDGLGGSGLALVVTGLPALFRLLYDSRYQSAAPLAQLLCLPCLILMLRSTATSAVLALGDSRALSRANFVLLIARLPLCVAGFAVAGVTGIVIGSAVGTYASMLPMYSSLRERDCSVIGADLRVIARTAVLAVAGAVVPGRLSRGIGLPLLLVEVLVACALMAIAAVTGGGALRDLFRRMWAR